MRQASVVAIDGDCVLYEANEAGKSETIDLLQYQHSRSLYEAFMAQKISNRIANCFLIYEYLSEFEDSSNNAPPDQNHESIIDRISEPVRKKLIKMYDNSTIEIYDKWLYIRKNSYASFDDLIFTDETKIFPDELCPGLWVQSSEFEDIFIELRTAICDCKSFSGSEEIWYFWSPRKTRTLG